MAIQGIKIELTPSKYLSSESRYIRAKLLDQELDAPNVALEVLHDRENENDALALEVFCNRVSIGYIRKHNNEIDIDRACFLNGKKNKLNLELNGDEFTLIIEGSGCSSFFQFKGLDIKERERITETLYAWADEYNASGFPDDRSQLLHLTELKLSCMKSSPIPPELGMLLSLEKLTFNKIWNSELPNTLVNLINLKELYLDYCGGYNMDIFGSPKIELPPNLLKIHIKGYGSEIPVEQLSYLEEFHLIEVRESSDYYESLMTKLFHNRSLRVLNINKTGIKNIPPCISQLTNLEYLIIHDARNLNYLPSEVGELKSLKVLSCIDVFLKKIPPEIGCMSQLIELHLGLTQDHHDEFAFSRFEEIPEELVNLKRLESLDLRQRLMFKSWPLYFTFPKFISEIESLKFLDLSSNSLTEIPESICNLKNLESVDFSQNDIERIPKGLGGLVNLRYLGLVNNHLLPELPDDILDLDIELRCGGKLLEFIKQTEEYQPLLKKMRQKTCDYVRLDRNYWHVISLFERVLS